jgi:hypothetical protein
MGSLALIRAGGLRHRTGRCSGIRSIPAPLTKRTVLARAAYGERDVDDAPADRTFFHCCSNFWWHTLLDRHARLRQHALCLVRLPWLIAVIR